MQEAALLLLALVCAGLLGCSVWLAGRLRELAAIQQQRYEDHERRVRELVRRLDTYLAGSVRMGEELQELKRTLAPLPEKLSQIEQRDPDSLSFTQAAKLVGLGASADDLTHSCGLSKAEAELVARLHQAKR